MKTVIFYFTATGNSLVVARDLAAELGNTQLVSIPRAAGVQDISAFDRIGIIFPVYMFGLPLAVADFIKSLKGVGEKYIFAVATYGGAPGGAMLQAKKLLAQRGLKLSAGFGVRMPGNYTPLYGALPEEKQQAIFKKEPDKVRFIAEFIRRGKAGGIVKNFFLFNWLSGMIYRICSPKIPLMDTKFCSTDRCNGCGVCVRVCPVTNIRMSDSRPKWLHHCQQCLSCLHWCPQTAIEYAHSTEGRKRYHHPDVEPQDIIDSAPENSS